MRRTQPIDIGTNILPHEHFLKLYSMLNNNNNIMNGWMGGWMDGWWYEINVKNK